MTDFKELMKHVRVEPGKPPNVASRDASDITIFDNKEDAKLALKDISKEIDEWQDKLYAEGTRSLLIILQGMDTSGKDGTIRSVFRDTSPLGVVTTSFKRPTDIELAHDYLWRVHKACPPRGTIGVFNRSHYEDVLVARVHALAPEDVIEQRYAQINAFEKMLHENGTRVLKFMLNISKAEQKERLQARLDEPSKNWKFNPGDLADRAQWDSFMDAYEVMMERCSTSHAPWHVVPADRKWARDIVVATIVRDTLVDMKPQYPRPSWRPEDFLVD
jgi:PPK2 family polyphosphate:nucleotide phosphotransferase